MLMNAGGIDVPTNEGLFAPVTTVFREGSLLNPRFPASSIFGNQMCDEVLESIMLALADALPDRVTAGWNQLLCTALAGVDPRTQEPSVSLSIFMRGGPGAMKGADGFDALGFTGTPGSMRSPDMEMFELSTPHFMEQYEYLPDSAGAGEWRGGLGTVSRWRFYGARRARRDDRRRRQGRGRRPGARALRRRAGRPERAPAPLSRRLGQGLGLEGDRLRHPRGHDLRGAQRGRRRLRRPAPPRRAEGLGGGARRAAHAREGARELRRRCSRRTAAASTRPRRQGCRA